MVAELGGTARASYRAVARRAELVLLCHERDDLGDIAEAIVSYEGIVVSTLERTPLEVVHRAYADRAVYRVAVNRPAAIGRGVTVLAGGPPQPEDNAVHSLFARLGRVVVLDDALVDTAAAVMRDSAAAVEMHGRDRVALEQLSEFLST